MRVVVVGLAVVSLAIVASACGDLKHADEDDPPAGTDAGPTGPGSSSSSGSSGSSSGADASPDAPTGTDSGGASALSGPGPHGSLPSGYCCTEDSECRYRHCVDTGSGGKMCLDECATDTFCTRPDLAFTCDPVGSPRLCKPSAGFACIPASKFERGKRQIGACCNAGVAPNNDGTAGSQCEGNQCAAVGASPLVCTHRCESQGDCIGGFACIQFGTSKACVPTSSAYTCE